MVEQSFKERVRLKLMDCAVLYYELLVQKDYLIFSRNFRYQKYYIVSAFEDNFLHLTGVHTNLKAKNFFEKCYQKTLEDGDFNTLRAIYPQRKGRMSSILYREAGNSIVVNILEAILQKLLAEVF